MKLTVLDLFSGIGGFSLGLENAGHRTVGFCENNPNCRRVLKKHWPQIPIFPDVRELNYEILQFYGAHRPQIICGGFPCQDISCAGKQRGITGERSGLWFGFLRLITELRPDYAIIENVANLRNQGLSVILHGLRAVGYDAEWHIIPAAAVGKFHLRERLWIVAYASCERRFQSLLEDAITLENVKRFSQRSKIDLPFNGGQRSYLRLPSNLLLDDGVPRDVGGHLEMFGNSLVPQIAEIIGAAISKDYLRFNI